MSEDLRTLQVGAVTVSIINIGDVQEDLNRMFDLPEAERAGHPDLFGQPRRLPIHCIHLGGPGLSVLVDAGLYDYPPDAPQLIPGYQPPLDLFGGLAESHVRPADIQQVIITHAHGDHFNALTELRDGEYLAAFPNARHYLGRADWDAMQKALQDPDSLESHTFGVLHKQNLLELVDQPLDLGHGVQIIPAPGESPGHQVVRIHSEGQTLYCVGDLYHFIAEVEQPTWAVKWTNATANQRSRATFNETALKENALLIATHIHEIGRLQRTNSGETWVAA
ncbi:MAG: MBL fold metallo-hydrolase [Chloroflexi bacterium]|nr:MBL fold metallo-hydrolase [Chloroflexota bacterium]